MLKKPISPEIRVSLIYVFVGTVWILVTDNLVGMLVANPRSAMIFQTYKGWLFVLMSALLIFLLLRRELILRAAADMAVRQSEQRYRQIVETAQEGIWIIDVDDKTTFVNEKLAAMLGYTVGEMQGSSLYDYIGEAEQDEATARVARRQRGIAEQHDFKFRRKDGSELWAILGTNPILDERGLYAGALAMVTDITERKQVEHALQQALEQTRRIIDANIVGVVLATPQGRVEQANDYYLKMIGYTRQEFEDDLVDWRALTPPEWLPADERAIQELREQGVCTPYEKEYLRRDGSRVCVYFSDAMLPGPEERIVGFALDITERKQAEKKIRESETRFSTIFQASPIGIHLFRISDGCSVNANEAFLELIGYSRDELIGHSAAELNLFVDRKAREAWMATLHSTGKVRGVDAQLRHKSGEIRDTLASIDTIEIGGERMGLVIVADITERKKSQNELQLSRNRLADLSRRLVEVHESESRAIGRELHDQIGQMLTALKITLDMSRQLPAAAAAKKITQALDLTGELLERVSRLSLELRPRMLDDLGLIPALIWHINRWQDQSDIAVEFKHSGVANKRFASEIETTAYRVVQESLTNVARHARAGRVGIEIQNNGMEIQIQIEDNGSGFEPQAAFALNRGLSSMRERAQLVDGTFQITSATGQGTRITIRLPLKEHV